MFGPCDHHQQLSAAHLGGQLQFSYVLFKHLIFFIYFFDYGTLKELLKPPRHICFIVAVIFAITFRLYSCMFVCILLFSLLAADIPRCRAADTDCITRTSTNLVHQYARTGYPSAGFPIIEPFIIKRFDISDGRTGSLNLKLNFRDVNVEGLSGVKIDRSVWVNFFKISFSLIYYRTNLICMYERFKNFLFRGVIEISNVFYLYMKSVLPLIHRTVQ